VLDAFIEAEAGVLGVEDVGSWWVQTGVRALGAGRGVAVGRSLWVCGRRERLGTARPTNRVRGNPISRCIGVSAGFVCGVWAGWQPRAVGRAEILMMPGCEP
jgi:hypothetical protein